MSGWSQLGAALGGGPQMKQQAYQYGVMQGAQQASLLEQAVERRNKNLALAAITPEALQAQDPAGQASVLATLLRSGIDPRQLSGYENQQQTTGFRQSAMAEALKPTGVSDQNMLNRELAVLHGQPVTLSAVQGGVSLNPQVTPDQNAFTPTDIGQALIGADNARANASNAAAGASSASAARQYAGIGADKAANYDIETDGSGHTIRINKLTGEVTPLTMADGSPLTAALKGKAGASEKVAPSVYTGVFGGTSATGKPNAKMQEFMAYRALHPEMGESEALQSFELADTNVPNGNFGSASNMAQALSQPSAPASADPTQPGIPSSAGAASKPKASSGPAMPKTQAEFDALPSGTKFINPANGQLMVKK